MTSAPSSLNPKARNQHTVRPKSPIPRALLDPLVLLGQAQEQFILTAQMHSSRVAVLRCLKQIIILMGSL